MTDSDNNFELIKQTVFKELEDEKILIHKHGSLSWEIFNLAEEWANFDISDSFFRQKIRELVNKHIDDRHI